ncbi:MAG: hypothetical protein L0I24_00075 [Pseudonocardia sp.]|nr:hypothetical protein [Pseudonocardia sp.]
MSVETSGAGTVELGAVPNDPHPDERIRPRLKADVFWIPHPGGATFVQGPGQLTVNGSSTMVLMDRLAPYLDGGTALGDLVAALPLGKREMVTSLVGALLRAGMVKDVADDRQHGLTDAELLLYADEIAYIDHYLDSAGHRFHTFRETPLLCVGSGLSFTALIHACLAAGATAVTAAMTGECATDAARLQDYGRSAAERDPKQTLAVLDGFTPALARRHRGAVLHVSDRPMPDRAHLLDGICAEACLPLVQGVMVGDQAWTGPVSGIGGMQWTSAWLRGAGRAGRDTGVDPFEPRPAAASPFLAGPTAAVVANRVSFLAFQHITGISEVDRHTADPAERGRGLITVVDLETLQSLEHRFHVHPAAVPAGPEAEETFSKRYRAFRTAVMPTAEDLVASATACSHGNLGLFAEIEDESAQLPLYVTRARVADPYRLVPPSGDGPGVGVIGAGVTQFEARLDRAVTALSAYAALAVDRRRVFPDGHVFAHDLVHDKAEVVPADRVYPVLAAAHRSLPFRAPLGLAVGADADAALTRGLLAHVVARTATAALTAETPFDVVDLDELVRDDELAARYVGILKLAGVVPSAYDVTSDLGVVVHALCVEDRTVAYTAGSDLAAGLRDVVLGYQGFPSPPELAPPQLPAALRGVRFAEPRTDAPSWRELAQVVADRGWQVHAVPAGHDPVVTGVLPVVVQVALGV